MPLNQQRLKELIYYDPVNGDFFWRYDGRQAGHKLNKGTRYPRIKIDGVTYAASRLAVLYMTGKFPDGVVDHEDGNTLNSKWENLRCTTQGGNNKNLAMPKTNKSGCVGVSWCPIKQRWFARIQVDKRLVNLGRHKTYEEAVAARKTAEAEYGFHKNHGRRYAAP